MILGKQSIAGFALALFVASTLPAQAGASLLHGKKKKDDDLSTSRKPNAAQNALIDQSIAREKVVIKTVKDRAPLVETYIQNMKPDALLGQVPDSDEHFLGRVEFSKVIGDQTYAVNKETSQGSGSGSKLGFFKHSASFIGGLGGSLHLTFHEAGFVQMLLMDSTSFDRQHYNFGFVRNDFLGNTPTAVFDVTPIQGKKRVLAASLAVSGSRSAAATLCASTATSRERKKTRRSSITSTAGAPTFSLICGYLRRSMLKRATRRASPVR